MSVASPRSLFKQPGRYAKGGPAVSVRIPDDLLQRLAIYGNAKGLPLSETVRRVLEQGLDHAMCKR